MKLLNFLYTLKRKNVFVKFNIFKKIAFILIFSLFSFSVFSQNGCPNASFATHDFTNWQGYTGVFTNCCPTPGIVPGRHSIIDTSGTDPNTGNALSILPPGLNVGARLGNSNVGAEAERLRYSLYVDTSNTVFFYSLAVVFEDPSHAYTEQPKFTFNILDANGNSLDSLFNSFTFVSGSGLPGFQNYISNRWRDWQTVGVNLSQYIGQNISIEFTSFDCAQSGHFGYAYLSCDCSKMIITASYNFDNSQVTLSAPRGFSYLWSPTNDTTQSIIINNPVNGSTYNCELTAITGYHSILSITLDFPLKINHNYLLTGNNVFPNPASNYTTINLPEKNKDISYSYIIHNAQGELILRGNGVGNKINCNTENLRKGIYFIKINTSSNNSYFSKITII